MDTSENLWQTMQRAPCVFRVASLLCPMRIRSRTSLKRLNTTQERAAQAEKDAARYRERLPYPRKTLVTSYSCCPRRQPFLYEILSFSEDALHSLCCRLCCEPTGVWVMSVPLNATAVCAELLRVCVCFLPIHSGHQVRWTYQPGSHRRKVTQDF